MLLCLKEDAKRLEQKKHNGNQLTPQEEEIIKFRNIDVVKIYKAFTTFDRMRSIDIYYEKNKHSINMNKWDPFIKYLKHKTTGTERSMKIEKYLLSLIPELITEAKADTAPPLEDISQRKSPILNQSNRSQDTLVTTKKNDDLSTGKTKSTSPVIKKP